MFVRNKDSFTFHRLQTSPRPTEVVVESPEGEQDEGWVLPRTNPSFTEVTENEREESRGIRVWDSLAFSTLSGREGLRHPPFSTGVPYLSRTPKRSTIVLHRPPCDVRVRQRSRGDGGGCEVKGKKRGNDRFGL